jgi:cytoskeletal protein CcmA (bactofilin family)
MAVESISKISEYVKINGTLDFPGSVEINGEVVGDIRVGGCLIIGKNAKVESNIYTKDVIISGYFEGKMQVSGQIEIKTSGKFIGDLIQDKELLIIEKGGLFKGNSINDADDEKNINTSEEEDDINEHIQ